MQAKHLVVAAVSVFVVTAGTAVAGPPLKLVSWGDASSNWLTAPSGLPALSIIEGGATFVLGVADDASLVGWGYFEGGSQPENIPFFIPDDVDKVRLVRAGYRAAVAVRDDGFIRIWGAEIRPAMMQVPNAAIGAVDIAIGNRAIVALTESGQVVAWGEGDIVSLLPGNLGDCVDVFAVGETAGVVRASGEVVCWASTSDFPSCFPPFGQSAIQQMAAVPLLSAALREDGSVSAWGSGSPTAIPAPPATDLVACIEVVAASSVIRLGAIRADGVAFQWGQVPAGAGIPVPQPGAIRQLAFTKERTFALIDEFTDCNGNGLDDSAEIEAGTELDCNGDWIPDTCQFAEGIVEDCNGNGLADACEKASPFEAASANLGPIGFGSPQSWSVDDLPAAASHATLSVSAKGDFSSVNEYVVVRLNGDAIGVAFIDGSDCAELGPESITISAATLNALVGPDGTATFTFEPTIAVNASACPSGTWVAASLSYNGATELDCNANGLLDACEIAAGYAEDCNLDGIPDSCQDTTADCNANRVWDACDIASGAADDCNGNGVPDTCDIGSGSEGDCNSNGRFDECEIADGSVPDCDDNGIPDACDVDSGAAADCNANGIPDACDIADGQAADCNSNGVPDICDIAAGTEIDINSNGVPDSCEGLGCPGDLNDDEKVDAADLAVMLGFWGPVGTFPAADIDGSGTVDAGDLAILLGGWGPC